MTDRRQPKPGPSRSATPATRRLTLRERLDSLSIFGGQAVESTLAEAIPWAEAGEIEALVRRALAAPGRRSMAAVLVRWADLPASSQAEVLDLDADLALPLADALRWRPRSAPALADFAARSGDWRLALPVGRSRALNVDHDAMAEALLAITRATVGPAGRGRPGRLRVLALDEAVDAALAAPRRGPRAPTAAGLAAAIMATRPGPRVAAALDDVAHPVHAALRSVAAGAVAPDLHGLTLRWLGDRRLQGLALRVIARTRGAEAWTDVLAQGHLLIAAGRRRPLRTIDRGPSCLPDAETARDLAGSAATGYVRLIDRVPLSRSSRRRAFAIAPEFDGAAARLLATDAAAHAERELGDEVLSALVRDADRAVSRRAAHHLRVARGALCGRLGAAESAPHVEVAARARALLARRDAEAFFARWMALDAVERRAAAAQVDRSDCVRFRQALQRAFQLPQTRWAALDLVRRLRLADPCEDGLIGLLDDPDARTVATSIAVLGTGRRVARGHLVAMLDHPDPRVRANTIEVVGAACGARLVTILRAGEGRERANAARIVAPLQPDLASETIVEMLNHPDAGERARGVWSARGLATRAVREAIAAVAGHDADPVLRARARVVHLLHGASA